MSLQMIRKECLQRKGGDYGLEADACARPRLSDLHPSSYILVPCDGNHHSFEIMTVLCSKQKTKGNDFFSRTSLTSLILSLDS